MASALAEAIGVYGAVQLRPVTLGPMGWVTHKSADWIRRRRRDRELAQTLQNREPRPVPSDLQIESGSQQRAALVRAACMNLPMDLRAIVSLYYGEGMSLAVIADDLGVPIGTIKSRLHEARAQLKSLLERNPA